MRKLSTMNSSKSLSLNTKGDQRGVEGRKDSADTYISTNPDNFLISHSVFVDCAPKDKKNHIIITGTNCIKLF